MIALVVILAAIGICLLVANEANRFDDDRWVDEEGHRWPPGGPSRKGDT